MKIIQDKLVEAKAKYDQAKENLANIREEDYYMRDKAIIYAKEDFVFWDGYVTALEDVLKALDEN